MVITVLACFVEMLGLAGAPTDQQANSSQPELEAPRARPAPHHTTSTSLNKTPAPCPRMHQ